MARRQARRTGGHGSSPILLSFAVGLVSGLGLATVVWMGGYLPGPSASPATQPAGHDEPPLVQDEETTASRRYDFFTVLPEIEVVIPQEEIEQRARQRTTSTDRGPYLIQVGSFRAADDADGLRAQLTLLGLAASVETVKVNDATWHRVRVGPYDSAREADGARRRLLENGHEALVLSGQ